MMLKNLIKEEVKKAIKKSCDEGKLNLQDLNLIEYDVVVEKPKQFEFGDFAVNISSLAKYAKLPPVKIAEIISSNLAIDDIDINIVAGFINFKIGNTYLENIVKEIIVKDEKYAENSLGQNKKVILEYVSANPTGPFHIGHGRWAAVGSSLANILKLSSYYVFQEFYINDAGNQIRNLGNSLYIRIMQELGNKSVDFPQDEIEVKNYYTGDYLIEIAKKFVLENSEYVKIILESGLTEDNLKIISDYAKKSLFELQEKTLEQFNVKFDNFFSEQSLHDSLEVEKCIKYLKDTDMLYEKDGAIWFKSSQLGDSQDRVIKKSDGSNTYLTADIAYHLNKLKRGFDILLNIWGADHHGYIPRMKAAISALGYNPDSLEVLLGQLVNLLVDGEQMRMGKRSKMLTLQELIDEVGVDATRFWMVMRSIDTTLDFDVNLAKSNTEDNPVFYVQYAHARGCSILRNAVSQVFDIYSEDKSSELKQNLPKFEPSYLEEVFDKIENLDISNLFDSDKKESFESTKKIVLKLEDFKNIIYTAALNRSPYLICKYLQELSALFHQFYNINRVLSQDENLTISRLALVKSFIIIMKTGLNLIGVNAVERM